MVVAAAEVAGDSGIRRTIIIRVAKAPTTIEDHVVGTVVEAAAAGEQVAKPLLMRVLLKHVFRYIISLLENG